MVFPDWTIERKTEAALLFRAAKRREYLSAVQRLIAKAEVERAVPVVDAGFGDHVDKAETGVVIFCGVRIQAETNLANLRFRRQLAAAKTVDAKLRAGAGELVDCVLKLVRIVGQLGDLVRSHDV